MGHFFRVTVFYFSGSPIVGLLGGGGGALEIEEGPTLKGGTSGIIHGSIMEVTKQDTRSLDYIPPPQISPEPKMATTKKPVYL